MLLAVLRVLGWMTVLALPLGIALGRYAGVRRITLARIALTLAAAAAAFWLVALPEPLPQPLIPVVIALPAAIRPSSHLLLVSAILVNLFAIIAGFSIGMYYAPAAVALWAAVGAPRPVARALSPAD